MHIYDDLLIKPKNDFVFKKIFGDEKNKDLLISLLNSILTENIKDITLLNNELTPDYYDSKKGILDICAVTDKGVQIDVEIQLMRIAHMPERSLFYWSKMYIHQISKGQDYSTLNKTITINILDYNFIDNEKYHNCFHVSEDEENIRLTDVLEIHFIEMKKEKGNYNNDKLAQWIEFIKADSEEVMRNMAETNADIKKALELLLTMNQDKDTRAQYMSREMALRDELTRIAEGREEGRAEGRAEGREEGRAEGRAEGIQEGEIKKAIEIALKLLDVMEDKDIAKSPGLDIEQIKNLRKENEK